MFEHVIANAIILSAANGYKPFTGSVAVQKGLIELVTEDCIPAAQAVSYLDAEGAILMPGLFNCHCHAEMSFARGLGDGRTLLEQKKLFSPHQWFYPYLTEDDRYWARQLSYGESLLGGVTFLNDNMYWSLGTRSVPAMVQAGTTGALSEDVRLLFSDPDLFLSHEAIDAFAGQCRKAGIVPVLAGPAEEDFLPERLRKIAALRARADLLYTCHLAETTWRLKLCQEQMKTSPVRALRAYGLLNQNLIGSHAVHLTEEDILLMAQSGMTVANTPLCELKIADGIAPITDLVRAGVNVALGTDGALWNNSNDIFREMKAVALLASVHKGPRALGAKEILDMATVNGAKAFHVEERLGKIVPGMQADLILIDGNLPHMQPLRLGKYENVTSAVVYCATGQNVKHVMKDGNWVVRDRQLLTMDIRLLIERGAACSQKIVAQLERDGYAPQTFDER